MDCGGYERHSPTAPLIVMINIIVILQLRVHALYGNIRLTILNAGLFLAEIVLMLMFWVLRPIMCKPLGCFTLDSGIEMNLGSQTVGFVGSQGAFQSRCADGSEGVILPLYWIPGTHDDAFPAPCIDARFWSYHVRVVACGTCLGQTWTSTQGARYCHSPRT